MEGRRVRRFGRVQTRTLLPLHIKRLSNTVSCWYCDVKTSAFNDPLFRLGRTYSRYLRVWFSAGIGFSLTAMLGVCMILLWELARVLHLYDGNAWLSRLLSGSLFGIFPSYVAVFLAVLFPGALVAFNYELLQALPSFATLRIYCAGIWHNAACCALCGLALFLLPLILYPFYIHGESPMSGWRWLLIYMRRHFKTQSVSIDFHNMIANGKKGYCVPSSLIEASKDIQLTGDQSTCPNQFTAFTSIPCFNSNMLDKGSIEGDHQKSREVMYCLIAKDIVKLKKCGDGWGNFANNKSSCLCSEDESCLTPVQAPGLTWVEITYSSPYILECWQNGGKSFAGVKSLNFEETSCGGTFVFIGDVISMAHSVRLTAYRPRWMFSFGALLPNVLEKILVCTFHFSLALALLNSLPVYFLDGESILEVTLCYMRLLNPRMKGRVLQLCLLGGTLIFILASLRIVLFTIL
ncbi:hypothetical protein LOK49_LG09G02740 [Camellia lanceoleosa]|uniref:Uncharacterized protein n=1 Tax=Camellia lanceoleosa TaxID=1840588 RepID=A0ACC0GIX4_9ERIC|nr:hypothetical protein LOK49_LG09G02740 [Camellia lanceoleosa]